MTVVGAVLPARAGIVSCCVMLSIKPLDSSVVVFEMAAVESTERNVHIRRGTSPTTSLGMVAEYAANSNCTVQSVSQLAVYPCSVDCPRSIVRCGVCEQTVRTRESERLPNNKHSSSSLALAPSQKLTLQ